jgi:hypothetical protein
LDRFQFQTDSDGTTIEGLHALEKGKRRDGEIEEAGELLI